MDKTRVLFLCSANSARSQMAEALLRKRAGDQFEVHSAGILSKPIHPTTIRVLREIGIDTSSHYSKDLNTYIGKVDFGFLITVCAKAEEQCPFFPGMGQRLHWPFEDPAAFVGPEEDRLEMFREVRDQIDAHIGEWLAELE